MFHKGTGGVLATPSCPWHLGEMSTSLTPSDSRIRSNVAFQNLGLKLEISGDVFLPDGKGGTKSSRLPSRPVLLFVQSEREVSIRIIRDHDPESCPFHHSPLRSYLPRTLLLYLPFPTVFLLGCPVWRRKSCRFILHDGSVVPWRECGTRSGTYLVCRGLRVQGVCRRHSSVTLFWGLHGSCLELFVTSPLRLIVVMKRQTRSQTETLYPYCWSEERDPPTL